MERRQRQRIIDLHVHSNCSDGAKTPKELIDMAVNNGVEAIAIADHDTVMAYTPQLYDYATSRGVKLITAVEVSTKLNGKVGIHILGYNFDIHNSELNDMLYQSRNSRHIYLVRVAEALNKLGYIVNVAELDKVDAVTKAHIALDVISNSANADLINKNFGHIPSKGEFIETVMNEGCPAYVLKPSITPQYAGEVIKRAGGKVVIAHPVAYVYEDGLEEKDIERLIEEMQPFGLEVNYIYTDRYDKIIDECDRWRMVAKKHNLIATIGSDYHTTDGIRPEIGLINTDLRLSSEEVKTLLTKLCD